MPRAALDTAGTTKNEAKPILLRKLHSGMAHRYPKKQTSITVSDGDNYHEKNTAGKETE